MAGRDTNVPTGVQAPVLRVYPVTCNDLTETHNVMVFALRESPGHPRAAAILRLNFLPPPKPDDVSEELDMICIERTICSRDLAKEMARVDEQYFVATRSFHLTLVEKPKGHRQCNSEEHIRADGDNAVYC